MAMRVPERLPEMLNAELRSRFGVLPSFVLRNETGAIEMQIVPDHEDRPLAERTARPCAWALCYTVGDMNQGRLCPTC
jgi:hypothetical protein